MPDALKKSYKALHDSEWWRLETIPELGGHLVPRTLVWAVAEQVLGANPALHMYMAGAPFAGILYKNGNETQKKMAQRMIDRGWGATMVLTEPDAGSDVGAGRTKAIEQADGSWHIEGVKRFITSAEHDMAENIVHLVLARPEGAGPGTKGLSLFVVPKFHFDVETGELGERNGAYVTNVEHKMGLKASTTCELRFGENPEVPGEGLARRRRARRHRPDVPGHRARPDDGRHEGDRDALDRLPQRARLREDPGAVGRPDPGLGQDRAARDDHQPPGRAPQPDAEQGLRRGPARARLLHRLGAGPDRHRGGRRDRRHAGRWRSTTCCCRS